MSGASDFERQVLAFEQAWRLGEKPPAIAEFLPAHGDWEDAERHRLLVELICLDLEYRWRSSQPLDLEEYARCFPELGSLDELPLEVIGEAYRVRRRWGDRPAHATFLTRFATRHGRLQKLLRQIDRELQEEVEETSKPAYLPRIQGPSQRSPVAFDSRAPLSYSDYLLQRMIGAGRTGKVYRAWQRSLNRPVAVKYLRKGFLRHGEAVERFIAEARTVASLQHPGIVGVHGLGRTPGGGYFIVMDWIDGSDLAGVIANGPIAIDDAVCWIIQACEAIEHAHDQGIIHCDLKPANLLLSPSGNIRVVDFGLARSLADPARADAVIAGTAAFMAPEQVSRYWGPLTTRTDVYGLGTVLYTLLTGRAPWQGSTLADVLAQVVSATPVVAPIQIRSGLSEELNTLCLRCLAKRPEKRYSTAQGLREALLALCG